MLRIVPMSLVAGRVSPFPLVRSNLPFKGRYPTTARAMGYLDNDKMRFLYKNKLTPPTLEESADAAAFFGNLEFYDGVEEKQSRGQKALEEKLKGKTVREALREFPSEYEAYKFFSAVECQTEWARFYFRKVHTLEELLTKEVVFPLYSNTGIGQVHKAYVELPDKIAMRDTVLATDNGRGGERTLPGVYLVLGVMGSGRTFFALKDVATVNVQHKHKVTLYGEAYFVLGSNKPPEADDLAAFIKRKISEYVEDFPESSGPLDMHMTLVLNRADIPDLQGRLSEKENIQTICQALDQVATSSRLVLCGSGFFGSKLDSAWDVYKFRMGDMSPRDVLSLGKKMLSS